MKIAKKTIITLLVLALITLGNVPESGGGAPSAFAAPSTPFSQDGLGFSNVPMTLSEVQGTTFTPYQNWPSEFTKDSYSFVGGVFDGENVWMIPYDASHLMKINSKTGEMTAYDNWPAGFTKGSNAFAGGVFDGTSLWLIPYNANSVIKVDVTTGTMMGYSNWPGDSRGSDQFIGGVFDGTNIWLTPYYGNRLIKVDATTGEMTAYTNWPSGTNLGNHPFYGAVFDGTHVWLIPNGADRIIRVDPSTEEMTGYTDWPSGFTKEPGAFLGGIFDGTNIWLIPYNATHVVKINTATEEMTGYNDWPTGFIKSSGSFAGGVYDGESIWLMPLSSNSLVKVNAETGVMTGYNNWPTGFTKRSDSFMGGVYDGESIWMIPSTADRVLRFGSITLSGLTLSTGDLSPTFDGVTKNYRVDVDNDVTSIDITPTVENTYATITVDGTPVVNGESHTIQVKVGANPILVTARTNNEDTITYEIIVTRAQVDSTITPTIADFDGYRGAHGYQDIDIQLDLLGNTLQQIELDGALVATDNYEVDGSGEKVTFKKAYLETLRIGTYTFTFNFSAGNPATFELTVRNSRPSGGGGTIPPPNTISSSGGTIQLDGVEFVFPQGAVSGNVLVDVNRLSDRDSADLPLPESTQFLSGVFDITAVPIAEFDEFLTLTLPFNMSAIDFDAYDIGLYWLDEETNTWMILENIQIDKEKGTVSGDVNHFTKFAILATKKSKEEIKFSDIDGHWAEDYIQQAAAAGIIKGYPDGTFKPNTHLTRMHAVSLLVRALGLESDEAAPFEDIENYATETQAEVNAAYKYGLVKGQNGNFMPAKQVTRSQIALMLKRAYEYKTGMAYTATTIAPFPDIRGYDEETRHAITMLYEFGIVEGSNGYYMPNNQTTRAQAAKIFINSLNALQ